MPDPLTPAAEAFLGKWADEDWSSECRGLMMRADLAALLEAVRGEERERWIPTAEALPAEGEEVLVWPRKGTILTASWDGRWKGRWWIECEDGQQAYYPRRDAFTHWQPLPPGPPEEGEQR